MHKIDYQALYRQLPDNEKQVYLALVERTRIAVHDAIVTVISHKNIEEGVVELRGNISSLISELMGYIAENDVVGFSFNPGTDLRHDFVGLGKGLDGFIWMLKNGKMDCIDENGRGFLKEVPDKVIYKRAKIYLKQKLKKFEVKPIPTVLH